MATDGIRYGVIASALGGEPRRVAREAREAGFQGVLFEAISAAIDLTALSGSGRREFRRVLLAQEEQIVGLRADLGPAGFGPGADIDRAIAQLDKAMETAAGLGSPLVCVDLGPLPSAPNVAGERPAITPLQAGLILLPQTSSKPAEPPPPSEPPPDPAFVDRVNSAMVELGHHADRYSVMMAFRTELASFASLEEALRRAACPWFGVDLDPVALLRDEWEPDEFFSRLGPLVRHVRARDAVGGAGHRTKPAIVGQGSVPWESLLTSLDAAGYQGWITLDPVDVPDRARAAVAGLKYLRSLTE
jgi:sugar phosphate isomerase/epimerase